MAGFKGSARQYVHEIMQDVDPVEKVALWNFLRNVLMGISRDAEVDSLQRNLFGGILQEFFRGDHSDVLESTTVSMQFSFQISTWINGAYCANQV